MTVERGIVETIEEGFAWVKTRRKSACGHCGSKDHCAMVEGGDRMLVKAKNGAGARQGDVVEIYLDTAVQLKCTFIAYMVPVLGLMTGAFSANSLSTAIGLNPPVGMALFSVAGFLLAMLLARHLANRMVADNTMTPMVRRIIPQGRAA